MLPRDLFPLLCLRTPTTCQSREFLPPIYGTLQMCTSLATQSMALSKCAHHLQPNLWLSPIAYITCNPITDQFLLVLQSYIIMKVWLKICVLFLLVNDSVISSYQKEKEKGKKTITWKIHWENMAPFTLGVRANVQPKSSIPIDAKVEISPKGFTLVVKDENRNDLFNLPQVTNKCWTLWPCVLAPRLKKRNTIKFGKPMSNPWDQCCSIY